MSELPDTEPTIETPAPQLAADSADAPEDPITDTDEAQANAAFDFESDEPAADIVSADVMDAPAATAAESIATPTAPEIEIKAASNQADAEPAAPAEQAEAPTPAPNIPAEALAQALESALSAPDLEAYREFLADYAEDGGHDLDAIAAALAIALVGFMNRPRRDKARGARDRRDKRDARVANERRPTEEGMTQYRIDVGRSDGVQPRNIVGALTNEAELSAGDIGYIKIFDRFSLVELPETIPQDDLDHLAEVWVCGRKMDIRLDDGPPEQEGGKNNAPSSRREKRPQGRGGPRNQRDGGGHGRGGRDGNRQQTRGNGGQGDNRRNRSPGNDERRQRPQGGSKMHDDNFGNRIDYTPKDRGRLHNIIYGDGIANVGQDNGGVPPGLGKSRRGPGGGFKGKRSGGGGGPARGRRRQD